MQNYLLDDIIPKFRQKKFNIPDWAYTAAGTLATYELKGSKGLFFTTPGGLHISGHDAKAATFAAIMDSIYNTTV